MRIPIKVHVVLSLAAFCALLFVVSNYAENERAFGLSKAMGRAVELAEDVEVQNRIKAREVAESLAAAEAQARKAAAEAAAAAAEKKPAEAEAPAAAAPAVPAAPAYTEAELYPQEDELVQNGRFQSRLDGWHRWKLTPEDAQNFLKLEPGKLTIKGQANRLMGLAQAVNVVSGQVYRIGGKIRACDYKESLNKEFLGARIALNVPGQKEQQVVWLYKEPGVVSKYICFTNTCTGTGTLLLHTGYTANAALCEALEVSLIPRTDFPAANIVSANSDFLKGMASWNFWQIKEKEGFKVIAPGKEGNDTFISIKTADNRLQGLAQAVNVVSGEVYRLSAVARSPEGDKGQTFSGRVGFYAPGQKEHQVVWPGWPAAWTKRDTVFTNFYTGPATLFFHTGYAKGDHVAQFSSVQLVKKGVVEESAKDKE